MAFLAAWLLVHTTACAKVRAWLDPNVLTADYSLFSVAISPDGRYVAAGGVLSGRVTVWDRENGILAKTLSAGGQAEDLEFSPDGRYLVAGIGAPRWKLGVALWDTASWNRRNDLEIPSVEGRNTSTAPSVSFSPDARFVAAANKSDKNGGVDVWEIATGRLVRTLPCKESFINAIAYSPDGKHIAAGGIRDDAIEIWSVEHGTLNRVLTTGAGGNVEAIRFDPNKQRLIVGFNKDVLSPVGLNGKMVPGNLKGHIKVWNLVSNSLSFDEPCESGEYGLKAMDYSPVNDLVAVVGSWGTARTVRLFDANTGRLLDELKGHPFPFLEGVALSPDGRWLAACGGKYVRTWKISD